MGGRTSGFGAATLCVPRLQPYASASQVGGRLREEAGAATALGRPLGRPVGHGVGAGTGSFVGAPVVHHSQHRAPTSMSRRRSPPANGAASTATRPVSAARGAAAPWVHARTARRPKQHRLGMPRDRVVAEKGCPYQCPSCMHKENGASTALQTARQDYVWGRVPLPQQEPAPSTF